MEKNGWTDFNARQLLMRFDVKQIPLVGLDNIITSNNV